MKLPAAIRILVALAFTTSSLGAQDAGPRPAAAPGARKPLTIADYSKWRSIEDAVIAPDGKWVAYTLRFTNTLPADAKPVLHLRNLDTNQEIEIQHAHDGTFSRDSRWLAYQVDSVPPVRGPGARRSAGGFQCRTGRQRSRRGKPVDPTEGRAA